MIMVFSIFQITVGKSQNSKNKNQTNSKKQNPKHQSHHTERIWVFEFVCFLSFVICDFSR